MLVCNWAKCKGHDISIYSKTYLAVINSQPTSKKGCQLQGPWNYPKIASLTSDPLPPVSISVPDTPGPGSFSSRQSHRISVPLASSCCCRKLLARPCRLSSEVSSPGPNFPHDTVDERNPAAPIWDGWNPINHGMFTIYQLVRNFFHPQ